MKSDQKNFIQLEQESDKKDYYRRLGRFITFGKWRGKPLFYLGPDYKFFMPMYFALIITSVVACYFCRQLQDSLWSFVGAVSISIFELFIYAITAFLDPGIVQDPELDIEELQHNSQSICHTCKVNKKKGRYHCEFCDVCIDGHDHHCPWTSKCIGKGNIIPFYMFLITTSAFFIYHFLVSFNQKK